MCIIFNEIKSFAIVWMTITAREYWSIEGVRVEVQLLGRLVIIVVVIIGVVPRVIVHESVGVALVVESLVLVLILVVGFVPPRDKSLPDSEHFI